MKIEFNLRKKAVSKDRDMSLIGPRDKIIATIFIVSFIICIAAAVAISILDKVEVTTFVLLISAPFFIIGAFIYVQYKKWVYILLLAALDAGLFYLGVSLWVIFIVSFTVIGAAGVVGVVVLMQRVMFYRVVAVVEYLNVKEKLSPRDRIVAFMFSIPHDMDTRGVTMNYNLKRASIPWNEMIQTMSLGFMIGMFLWIYISMNPSLLNPETILDSLENSAVMFSLVLYIPLLVLPWSIFKSLNVRVETRYRDFKLYDGMKETLKRMAIPIFASFMFVLLAINQMSLYHVAIFIIVSVIFNMLIIGLTSIFFYVMFEAPLVDDIVSKWKVFRPVAMTMDIGNDVKTNDDVPETPKRNMSDYGKIEFAKTK